MTWAASSIDVVMQHGWGAAAFVGIGVLCIVTLVASVAAFAFRAVRPFQLPSQIDVASDVTPIAKVSTAAAPEGTDPRLYLSDMIEFDEKSLLVRIEYCERGVDFLNKKFNLFSQALGYLPSDVDGMALGQKTNDVVMIGRLDEIEKRVARISDKADGVKDGLNSAVELIRGDIFGLTNRYASLRSNTRSVIQAKYDLEYWEESMEELDVLAQKMSDPLEKPDVYESWREWTFDFDRLKSRLTTLCRYVAPYADVKDAVFEIKPDLYKSQNWKSNFNGMNEDQKHDYKTFRIIVRNFETEKSKVRSALVNAAYASI